MVLSQISLINFRNFKRAKIDFKPQVTVFFGDNAQGKTNLLEAIYLLSTGKSFRTREDHELISWGQAESRVSGKAGFLDIELTVKPTAKALLVNKKNSRLADLIGSFVTVLFTPSDVEIVSAGPDKRRRFLDQIGSILDKKYLHNLLQLAKILRNRNQTLWQLKQGRNLDLLVWDQQLAKVASAIWDQREALTLALNTELQTNSQRIAGFNLRIEYNPPFQQLPRTKKEEAYKQKLASLRNEETNKGLTVLGPHRDDFKIIAEEQSGDKIVSKDLSIYGSRGEQRSAALALKFSEVNLIKQEKREAPVLLLDEVLSELDRKHRELLLKEIRKTQAFITTTSLDNLVNKGLDRIEKYEVFEGSVTAR